MILLKRSIATLVVYAIIVALACSGPDARAQVYGFSTIRTSNFTILGATVGGLTTLSTDLAVLNGAGILIVSSPDAPQAYKGGNPPPQNFFSPKGQVDPDYSRGDSLISVPPASLAASAVAEAYLTSGGSSANSSGGFTVSAPITLVSVNFLNIQFNFETGLLLQNLDASGSVAAAGHNFTITITNNDHNVVFASSPQFINLTNSLSAPGNVSLPGTGTINVTTTVLNPGTYTLSLTGGSTVDLRKGASSTVPEPGTVALLGGLLVPGTILIRRRSA